MENRERKYQYLGKFETLFEDLEKTMSNNNKQANKNREEAYGYIIKAIIRVINDMPKSQSSGDFSKNDDIRQVYKLAAIEEKSDAEFSKKVMDVLLGKLQEAVPNGNYESIDMDRFDAIATEMIKAYKQELEQKDETDSAKRLKEKIDNLKEKIDNSMRDENFTEKKKNAAQDNIRILRSFVENLEKVKSKDKKSAQQRVNDVFANFKYEQRYLENQSDESPYIVTNAPKFGPDGQLIERGSSETRAVANLKKSGSRDDDNPFVTIHYGNYDFTCTFEEAKKMFKFEQDRENEARKNEARERIQGQFRDGTNGKDEGQSVQNMFINDNGFDEI